MQRDLHKLTNTHYEVLVVGGGVYGLFLALEAALRGLQVGLVEKGDFGQATSSNSLRVIHGGLRYLQNGDVVRMRQSIRERSIFLRMAPHLIYPMPFLFPTYGHGLRGKEVFAGALWFNDLVGFDRNWGLDQDHSLPGSRLISKEECCDLVPGLDEEGLTGGAVCYDAQVRNAERLLISIAQTADQAGADLANYVEVTGFLGLPEKVQGVIARDVLTGEKLEIQARLIFNASGPWVNRVLNLSQKPGLSPVTSFSRAFNILIKRQLVPNYAFGVYSRNRYRDHKALLHKGSRLYIMTPCGHGSLIGTAHLPLGPENSQGSVTEAEVMAFVEELNQAFPVAAIKRDDITWVYWGLLPAPSRDEENVQLTKRFDIKDHEREHGVSGLISVIGVKFTEARHVAEKSVNLAFEKLRKTPFPSLTSTTPVLGGKISNIEEFVMEEVRKQSERMSEEVIRSLITKYGTAYTRVLPCMDQVVATSPSLSTNLTVNLAEAIYGIREEGAQKLSDVVFRRMTVDLTRSLPEKGFLELCATSMSREMGWNEKKGQDELSEVEKIFQSGFPNLS